jgi:glycosyl transferase family 1
MTFQGIYSTESEAWGQYIPRFAERILVIDPHEEALVRQIRQREGVEVHGLWVGTSEAPSPDVPFDSVTQVDTLAEPPPLPLASFDAIVVYRVLDTSHDSPPPFKTLAPLLMPFGQILCAVTNRGFWRKGGSTPADATRRDTALAAQEAGLVLYNSWPDTDATAEALEQDSNGCIQLEGNMIPAATEAERQALVREYLFSLVRPDYNPVLHSRALFGASHPGWAYEVLSNTPARYLTNSETAASVAAERQLCLLAWAKSGTPQHILELFYASQALFYEAVSKAPTLHFAYHCQAEFWRILGNQDMASRLLRSLNHVAPHETTVKQLAGYQPETAPQPAPDEATPPWDPSPASPRVLLITNPRPHYGLDVLYDGLCSLLGPSNVCDYPWKPTLHGQTPGKLAHYPCSFDRPGAPLAIEGLLQQLRAGAFDVVLFGDFDLGMGVSAARGIIEAAGDTPLFLLDQQDDPIDNRPNILKYLGKDSAPYFKREMLACFDYGAQAYPLPFAYADGKTPDEVPLERSQPLFWAGHRQFGLRRLYLKHLESVFAMNLNRSYPQEEYTRAMLDSSIGLNIFGFGFDTVRYWEVPAHGCMLLSERLPIRVPHNFRDGESAVFFDDLPDLEAKVAHYLNHPEEARAIAQAGREHLIKHHSGSARAAQMLGWMTEHMNAG